MKNVITPKRREERSGEIEEIIVGKSGKVLSSYIFEKKYMKVEELMRGLFFIIWDLVDGS